jgi:hypothetical protein
MLIYAPNTPRLQLELGVLYYRIGAYEVAPSYFAACQSAGDRNQIKLYLAQLALIADPPPCPPPVATPTIPTCGVNCIR